MAKYKYEACERETDFNQSMADRSVFEVFTMDPAIMRKMDRAGATLIKGDEERGKFYTLPANMLTIRSAAKPRKPMTEEQRGVKRALMERLHAAQRSKAGDTVKTR